jgi:hypothetical protein
MDTSIRPFGCEVVMNTAKEEVKTLLDTLSDECTLEDVQYHIYVAE